MRPESGRAGGNGVADKSVASGNSTLVNRNVTLGHHRKSLRLVQAMWDAVAEICRREECGVGELCQRVDERRQESTLTAALRVYVLNYFKAAATERGHASAGHGTFSTRSGR
jgi:predicted DNA-binding ribbon-helix-helix protein